MDLLTRIKHLVVRGRVAFTRKAREEMEREGITRPEVAESILSATFVRTKRSRSPQRRGRREKVHIVEGFTYSGKLIYTKGTIRRDAVEGEVFYVLISAKPSTLMEAP